MDGYNHLSGAKHIKIGEGKRKKEYGVLTKIQKLKTLLNNTLLKIANRKQRRFLVKLVTSTEEDNELNTPGQEVNQNWAVSKKKRSAL